MSSLKKSVTQLLGLAPMALIMHISAAAAANTLNDRADEQRALLSSELATVSAPVSAPRSSKVARPSGDAQQQAREMLLGIHAGTPSGPHSSSKVARSTEDAQQQAREMLLGMHAGTPSGPAVASGKTEPRERVVAHSDMKTAVR